MEFADAKSYKNQHRRSHFILSINSFI